MMTLSHYRFRQTLLNKAREYKNVRVILVNEAYTSKTCTRCGFIHQLLKGKKVFKCPSCQHEIDRDWNGARNIFMRSTEALSCEFAFGAYPPLSGSY